VIKAAGHDQKRHQLLHREAVELVVGRRRNVRLVDSKLFGGSRLAQVPAHDHAVDGISEAQLRLPLVGIGIAEIGEYVAGAAGEGIVDLFRHP